MCFTIEQLCSYKKQVVTTLMKVENIILFEVVINALGLQ